MLCLAGGAPSPWGGEGGGCQPAAFSSPATPSPGWGVQPSQPAQIHPTAFLGRFPPPWGYPLIKFLPAPAGGADVRKIRHFCCHAQVICERDCEIGCPQHSRTKNWSKMAFSKLCLRSPQWRKAIFLGPASKPAQLGLNPPFPQGGSASQ